MFQHAYTKVCPKYTNHPNSTAITNIYQCSFLGIMSTYVRMHSPFSVNHRDMGIPVHISCMEVASKQVEAIPYSYKFGKNCSCTHFKTTYSI